MAGIVVWGRLRRRIVRRPLALRMKTLIGRDRGRILKHVKIVCWRVHFYGRHLELPENVPAQSQTLGQFEPGLLIKLWLVVFSNWDNLNLTLDQVVVGCGSGRILKHVNLVVLSLVPRPWRVVSWLEVCP